MNRLSLIGATVLFAHLIGVTGAQARAFPNRLARRPAHRRGLHGRGGARRDAAPIGNPRVAIEKLKLMAGMDVVHVPYKGGRPALN